MRPDALASAGEDVLGAAVDLAQQTWRDRLHAAYALGSLAHGGFSAVSDIDAAVKHFAARKKANAASHLARLALKWRDARPAATDNSAIAAVTSGLLPLYDEFLSDHEPRLREFARPDLAKSFLEWRQKLSV